MEAHKDLPFNNGLKDTFFQIGGNSSKTFRKKEVFYEKYMEISVPYDCQMLNLIVCDATWCPAYITELPPCLEVIKSFRIN